MSDVRICRARASADTSQTHILIHAETNQFIKILHLEPHVFTHLQCSTASNQSLMRARLGRYKYKNEFIFLDIIYFNNGHLPDMQGDEQNMPPGQTGSATGQSYKTRTASLRCFARSTTELSVAKNQNQLQMPAFRRGNLYSTRGYAPKHGCLCIWESRHDAVSSSLLP